MNALSTAEQLLRDGLFEQAAEAFARIADQLLLEGMAVEAATMYRKVLDADHNHDHALWQLADITAAHGRQAEARQYLTHLVDLRTLRDDEHGVADCLARLQALDAAPPPSRQVAEVDVDLTDLLADLGPQRGDKPSGSEEP
jgi:cytochrome c-type biogenesis protein CcmH/NrfG